MYHNFCNPILSSHHFHSDAPMFIKAQAGREWHDSHRQGLNPLSTTTLPSKKEGQRLLDPGNFHQNRVSTITRWLGSRLSHQGLWLSTQPQGGEPHWLSHRPVVALFLYTEISPYVNVKTLTRLTLIDPEAVTCDQRKRMGIPLSKMPCLGKLDSQHWPFHGSGNLVSRIQLNFQL